jgi:DNA processing protein
MLRLAYQFFLFSENSWNAFAAESGPSGIRRLFSENIFPRRTLREEPKTFDEALRLFEKVLERENALGVRTLTRESAQYPAALQRYLPPERWPLFLFLRGKDIPEEQNCVSIVGTRYPSLLGKEAAASFSAYAARAGLTIISGLAKGIDTLAHRESLPGTVAVLGSGVHGVYPQENSSLAEEILARGSTLVSPYPLEQVPLPRNFPYRNQLIAALSAGTLVVEGAESSGAAITGKLALEMGKAVVTLPQDFRTPYGRGAVRLQEAGALFATNEEEALCALFARLGGRTFLEHRKQKIRRVFSVAEFVDWTKESLPRSLALLEEGISTGKIERVGLDAYRLRKAANAGQ